MKLIWGVSCRQVIDVRDAVSQPQTMNDVEGAEQWEEKVTTDSEERVCPFWGGNKWIVRIHCMNIRGDSHG